MILKKRYRFGGPTLCDFEVYYEVTIIMTAGYWHKHMHIYPLNKTGSQSMDQYTDGPLMSKS